MRIGFDGKIAVSNMTGLGNYSRLVIEQLALEYPGNSHLIYTPKLKMSPRLSAIDSFFNTEFRLPPEMGLTGSLWRSFGITNHLRADRVDVYHGLSNELPLNIRMAGLPSVVTIHDVIYRRMPECYSPIDRLIYDFKYGRSCRNATRVIAVSERTKRDVVELYGIDPDKIDVIYQGCDRQFRRTLTEEERREAATRLSLPERYVLQVGTIESRKNLELTVRALPYLPPDVKLLAVGRNRKGYQQRVEKIAGELGVRERIVFRSDVPFSDLPAVNQLAEAIVYPSRYEGFGIPVLEALESCRPVVAATGSCLEEAGGDAALYVAPDDVQGMKDALNAILDGSAPVAQMIAKGKAHASRFNNGNMATSLLTTYVQAIRDHRDSRP